MHLLTDSLKLIHGFFFRAFLPALVKPPHQLFRRNVETIHRINIVKFLEGWQHRIFGRVLNIGAGMWDYPRKLFENRCEYISADIIDHPTIDVVCDIHTLTDVFEQNYFDFIVCVDVLEHVLRPREAIIQLQMVLKPEGILLLTTPLNFPLHGNQLVSDYWRFSSMGLFNLLVEEAGFRNTEIIPVGHSRFPFSYLVVAKK